MKGEWILKEVHFEDGWPSVMRDPITPKQPWLGIDCPRCGHCCPQPNQEPVAWANKDDLQNFDMRVRTGGGPYHTVPLYTTPPAAQPFWDLFDENQRLRAELKFNTTPPTVQLEQEPVAWRFGSGTWLNREVHWRYIDTLEGAEGLRGLEPLYTTPPQRQWVSLTMEDMAELRRNGLHEISDKHFQAIEAKLREKNT